MKTPGCVVNPRCSKLEFYELGIACQMIICHVLFPHELHGLAASYNCDNFNLLLKRECEMMRQKCSKIHLNKTSYAFLEKKNI